MTLASDLVSALCRNRISSESVPQNEDCYLVLDLDTGLAL